MDVAAGKCKSPAELDGCVWTRYTNDGDDVLDIGCPEGPRTITTERGELLEVAGCEDWTKA